MANLEGFVLSLIYVFVPERSDGTKVNQGQKQKPLNLPCDNYVCYRMLRKKHSVKHSCCMASKHSCPIISGTPGIFYGRVQVALDTFIEAHGISLHTCISRLAHPVMKWIARDIAGNLLS